MSKAYFCHILENQDQCICIHREKKKKEITTDKWLLGHIYAYLLTSLVRDEIGLYFSNQAAASGRDNYKQIISTNNL